MLSLLNLFGSGQKNFTAGGQITSADVPGLVAQGFTHIVCARPDAELMSGGKPEALSQSVARAAQKAGLSFSYMPVSGQPNPKHVKEMAAILAQPDAKIFGYCRSGMRAKNLRSLASRA